MCLDVKLEAKKVSEGVYNMNLKFKYVDRNYGITAYKMVKKRAEGVYSPCFVHHDFGDHNLDYIYLKSPIFSKADFSNNEDISIRPILESSNEIKEKVFSFGKGLYHFSLNLSSLKNLIDNDFKNVVILKCNVFGYIFEDYPDIAGRNFDIIEEIPYSKTYFEQLKKYGVNYSTGSELSLFKCGDNVRFKTKKEIKKFSIEKFRSDFPHEFCDGDSTIPILDKKDDIFTISSVSSKQKCTIYNDKLPDYFYYRVENGKRDYYCESWMLEKINK